MSRKQCSDLLFLEDVVLFLNGFMRACSLISKPGCRLPASGFRKLNSTFVMAEREECLFVMAERK